MTIVKASETLAATAGLSYLATESIIPEATWLEKLGTVSVVVVVCGFIVNWMMKQLEKKDQALAVLQKEFVAALQSANDAASKSHAENTALVVSELRESHAVKRQVADSLNALTAAIRDNR